MVVAGPWPFVELGAAHYSVLVDDPAQDLDGNGVVNFTDLALLKRAFFRAPGPSALAPDEKRNRLILDDVIQAIDQGRSLILLTERKDHLEYLAARLANFARHLVVLQGGMSTKERLVLATGRYIGEGFDDARLDTLCLALPISWKGTLIQYTGRLHRLRPGKTEVRIFDYVDCEVPMLLRMFEKRLRGYRAIGYARDEAPRGYAAPGGEVVVEYDEGVLRELEDGDEFA